jgi:hypothetical protein
MSEYHFALKFRLADAQADPGKCLNALFQAGCGDATIGIGQRGRIALDVARVADSALAAITSALEAVKRAIPGATLIEASPDFVGLAEVADMLGCSRQNLRKLMIVHAGTFPEAVHEGSQALWPLRPLLGWWSETQKRQIDPLLIEVADATMQVNIARERRRLAGARLPKRLQALLA